MSAPLSVNARARDLTFHVQDSCNFCCWSCCYSEDPRKAVYVHSDGKVVPFDAQKSTNDIESIKRCLSNLEKVISEMADDHKKDKEELLKEISSKIVPLNEDHQMPLTLGVVQRISSYLKSYLS